MCSEAAARKAKASRGTSLRRRQAVWRLLLSDAGSWRYWHSPTRLQKVSGSPRSRALIHVLGLPAPVLQHAFYDSDGFIGRTDFFWPEYGVIGEFDGDAKYLEDDLLGGSTAREAVLAEKKREDRLRALGYTVVRWDWKAVTKPELLGQKLAAAGLPCRNPRRVD
jgi:hypothetical protein